MAIAPQVLSEQDSLPSKKMRILPSDNASCLWKDFMGQKREDNRFGQGVLAGEGNQNHLCAPLETCSPTWGPSTGTQDRARTRILATPAVDDCCRTANKAQLALSPRGEDGNLPKSPGLGNLQESLYVEYCGWLYGLPENSLPKLRRKKTKKKKII